MSGINFGRVIGGGLLAGLIINISEFILNGVLLAQQMEAAMRSLNRPPVDNQMIVWFVVLGFALGIVTVWLYAAIRPRLGPGVRTAVCTALTVWFLAYVYFRRGHGGHAALPPKTDPRHHDMGTLRDRDRGSSGRVAYSEA